MSYSPSKDTPLVEKLGEIQELSAEIARETTDRQTSRVFSIVCDIISQYHNSSYNSLQAAAEECHEFLTKFDVSDFTNENYPGLEEKIRSVYERVKQFGDDEEDKR